MSSLRDFLSLCGLPVGGVGASDLHPRLSHVIASRLFIASRFDGCVDVGLGFASEDNTCHRFATFRFVWFAYLGLASEAIVCHRFATFYRFAI